jgi:hypothetical protein
MEVGRGGEWRGKLLTVWSAPNHQHTSGNRAAVLQCGFSEKNWIDFRTFGPRGMRIVPENPAVMQHYFA